MAQFEKEFSGDNQLSPTKLKTYLYQKYYQVQVTTSIKIDSVD